MKSFVFALLFLSQFGTLSTAVAAGPPLCSMIFADTPWGELRRDFQHNDHYTKEIPQDTAIKNQCNLGTCHLHSWLGAMEKTYTLRTGEVMTLSNHFMSAHQMLTRSIMQLKTGEENVAKVELGAGPLNSRDSILVYGVIPDGLWTPKTEFYKNPQAQVLKEYTENIIGRTKSLAAKVKDPAQKKALIEKGVEQLRQLHRDFVGELPKTFQWEGRQWTPQEFAYKKFSFFLGPQTQMIINANRKAMPYTERVEKDKRVYTDMDSVEKMATQLIDRGSMVYLSYEHHHEYVDKPTGIMSIRAFYTPDYAKPLTREQREKFDKNGGGHAVQIIGYERHPQTGHIVKWKIKNSWGENSGDEGYYHMYDDYFRAFAKGITYQEIDPAITLKMPVKGN
ncbi:C1 family peptidase [Bdellovibrio sp. HCB185ZH]|uniref:C1 family peptidase n=1 Tax=Bdellovibrio sp. HCB185ZH TaxID=3394235 RepID=UPI0039A45484